MSNGDPDNQTDLKALEHFVVENDELLELEERIGRFNIFDALGIVNAEIRHSNFLAWLLDPNESHGQGSLFLKAVLMDLLRHSPPELRPLSPVQIDGAELRGVDVRREWRNIDILVTCKDPTFVIAIENKVKSKEHSNQLERYRKTVSEEFGDTESQFVFLTRNGDEPTDEEWTIYTYEDLHRVLRRVYYAYESSIGDEVLAFLDHYIRLIESRFMENVEIDELCRTIYTNHRQALELIFERGRPNIRAVVEAITMMLEEHAEITVYPPKGRSVSFIPNNWLNILPPVGKSSSSYEPRQWFAGEFRVSDRKCELWFYACPTSDTVIREKIIQRLIDNKEEFGFKHSYKTITPQWSTIFKREFKIDLAENTGVSGVLVKAKAALEVLLGRTRRAYSALPPIVKKWQNQQNNNALT